MINLRRIAETLIGLGQATMDGPQDSGRQEDNRTGHEIHLEIEDDLYNKKK